MSDYIRTQVFASEEAIQEIKNLAATARSTPVIAVSSAHGLDSGGFAGDAWRTVNEAIYKHALAGGLPEIQGYYGFDPSSGEFLEPGRTIDE